MMLQCFLVCPGSSNVLVHMMQVIDAKIRQWSKGKEGNLRSLLTTMQHVSIFGCQGTLILKHHIGILIFS